MTDIKPENKAFYRATVFLRGLIRHGTEHAIISPGSRSTPLTLAAATLPALQKHVILDERSAAFTALGIGKATNQPAALICTSGTALANYYPAVIEARKSGVPLLLLTADRPAHLHGTGANQTINQQYIYGDYPVGFYNFGDLQDKHVEELAEEVYRKSQTRQGPVHVNFPFSKPLEPDTDFLQKMVRKNRDAKPQQAPQKTSGSNSFDDPVLTAISNSSRPLIILGQLAPGTSIDPIFTLADTLQAPVLSEQGAPAVRHSINGFEGFLRHPKAVKELEPDLILRFGLQPASKSVLQAIKHWDTGHHIHVSDTEWQSNIENTTTSFIAWNGRPFEVDIEAKSSSWLKKWKRIETQYFKQADNLFKRQNALTDGHVYHKLVPQIPEDWTVFISNSFPARDHSMFGRWSNQHKFTNRGASGIDGITSTAMGVNIGLNKPGVLFTGDLAFLHDSNALLNAKQLLQPLVIIVINNSGGSIFRMLPIAEHSDYFSTYFETPQKFNMSYLASTHGINYTLIESTKALGHFNLMDFSQSGIHLIECKTDPDASMEIRQTLWDSP